MLTPRVLLALRLQMHMLADTHTQPCAHMLACMSSWAANEHTPKASVAPGTAAALLTPWTAKAAAVAATEAVAALAPVVAPAVGEAASDAAVAAEAA